jgi:phosphatidate cytidylyltransferase
LTRVLSALVLIPAVLAVIWLLPPVATWTFVAIVAIRAYAEFIALVRPWPARMAGVVYVFVPLALIAFIRDHYGTNGPGVLMILLGVIVGSDSAQYYSGRAFGKRLLAPTISPKKTIAGAVGGLVASVAVAIGLGTVWLPQVSPAWMGVAGALMGVAGMAGDLFESSLKRRAGVKDSGTWIPGHGGVLDRIDSWLFAAPVFSCFLWWLA